MYESCCVKGSACLSALMCVNNISYMMHLLCCIMGSCSLPSCQAGISSSLLPLSRSKGGPSKTWTWTCERFIDRVSRASDASAFWSLAEIIAKLSIIHALSLVYVSRLEWPQSWREICRATWSQRLGFKSIQCMWVSVCDASIWNVHVQITSIAV